MENIFNKIASSITLSQEIVQKFEKAISAKQLNPGQKLPTEPELCRMFNVSRTALREALQILNAKGLISIQKGRGTFVNDFHSSHANQSMNFFLELNFSKEYILHIAQFRGLIEPHIAQLAAVNRSDDDVLRFERNIQQFTEFQNDDAKTAELDLQFHLTVAESSHNPVLTLVMEPIYKLLPKIKTLIVKKVKQRDQYTALQDHEKIFRMIKEQNGEGAFAAMQAHMQLADKHSRLLCESIKNETELTNL